MVLERADRLKSPPIVGERYLVPVLSWRFAGEADAVRWWPVTGHKHTDIEHFNFQWPHYHVDLRFLTRRHWSDVGYRSSKQRKLASVLAQPVAEWHGVALPKPSVRPMRCTMSVIEYPHGHQRPVIAINAEFGGTQCRKGKRGFVCPHRHIALGSVAPIDGVITCPMHGLRIDAETGVCLGPEVRT
jgi:hypothetical protein